MHFGETTKREYCIGSEDERVLHEKTYAEKDLGDIIPIFQHEVIQNPVSNFYKTATRVYTNGHRIKKPGI